MTPLREFEHYTLLGEIAEGGMGVVYQAVHRGLNRSCALKLIRTGLLATPDERRRFVTEAEAAARLDHPHIVRVGRAAEFEGQWFLEMELIEGGTLADRLAEGPLPAPETARLLECLARAVHHAHERGVLHRDLKPANILLATDGQPKLTDFGLARFLEKDSDLTRTVAVLGTPAYLAPELASGRAREATTAADVYSLGVILFECLTGRRPFQGQSPLEILRAVQENTTPHPSTLRLDLPLDLETICLKCLEKEPAKRYATAQELADDLARFLNSEPIQARPVSTPERFSRWCRRKPALAALWAAAFLLLVAVFTGIALAGLRNAAVRKAEQREYFAGITLADNYVRIGDIQRALDVLTNCPPRFRHWEWGRLMYLCHQEIATIHTVTNLKMAIVGGIDYTRLIVNPDQTRLVTVGEDGAATVWELRTGAKLLSTGGSTNRIIDMAFAPDGRRLALLGNAGAVELWDANESRRLFGFAATNGPVRNVTFNRDGAQVRVLTADSASVWDSQTGQFLSNAGPALPPERGSPDPQQLEPADAPGKIPTLSTPPRAAAPESRGPWKFQRLTLDPSGTRLATVDARRKVQMWDAETGALRHTLDGRFSVEARLFFTPDGKRLLVADPSAAPSTVWNTDTGKELGSLNTRVDSAAFNADGSRVATVSGDNVARVWSANSGREILSLKGHAAIVRFIAFSPDSERITTASEDGAVKIWRSDLGREEIRAGPLVEGLAFSPDGQRLAVAQDDHLATVWDLESGRQVLSLRGHLHRVRQVCFSPDGKTLVTAGLDKTVRIWDADTGRLQRTLRSHSSPLDVVALSPDGRHLATCARYGVVAGDAVRIWDLASGRELRVLRRNTNSFPLSLAFHPNGRQLSVVDAAGVVILFDPATGDPIRSLDGHQGPVRAVSYSSDGRMLATAGFDRMIHLWDPVSGRKIRTMQAHLKIYAAEFSPDGKRLVTATAESFANFGRPTAQIWEVETGRELMVLEGHRDTVTAATFSPDGRRIATADTGGAVRIWETFPWREEDYPGAGKLSIRERATLHAGEYWKQRLAAGDGALNAGSSDQSPSRIDRVEFPARDPKSPPDLIDLTEHYNALLNVSWIPNRYLHLLATDLASFPSGQVSFAGTPFDVRGVIQLRAPGNDWLETGYPTLRPLPERVEDIHVGRAFHRLRALLGTIGREPDGISIGTFVLHYADGSQREVEINYGQHVRDWWAGADASEAISEGSLAWKGQTGITRSLGGDIRIFASTFENPLPEATVERIDFVSKLTGSGPFLIALTFEP